MLGSRRRLRALLIALAAGALAVALGACGSSDSGSSASTSGGGQGAKIALLLPETKTTRYEQQDKPNFIKRVKELCPSCSVIYSNADQDASKQQQQAEAAITDGAKAIVISAVDVKSAAAIVQRANQANVPVIAYGRLIPNADIAYYVSIDPFRVGQQQAQVLDSKLSDMGVSDPRVVMINGSPTDSNSKPYKDGALSVFEQDGVKVVKSFDTPDWSPDKAQREMEQTITALGGDGFDAVYVANDGMASGAIAALKGAKIDPASKPVTGQDAELAGIQRILAGDQLMTVYQPLHQLASAAADLALPLAQGEQPDASIASAKVDNGSEQVPSVLLDTIAIRPGNVEGTIIKDGFLTADQICTPPYAKACTKYGVK